MTRLKMWFTCRRTLIDMLFEERRRVMELRSRIKLMEMPNGDQSDVV